MRLLLLVPGATVGEHLIELLLLRVCQEGINAIAAVLHDRLHTGAAVSRSEILISAENLNLLLAIGDDGPDLGNLRAAEPKLPGKGLCLALRSCGATLRLLLG